MAESNSNIEMAQVIDEYGHGHAPAPNRRIRWVGYLEAAVLASVAVATAWSGYQAAKWDGQSAKYYARAESTGILSQEKATLAGQDRLYDSVTFNGWINAKVIGRQKLVEFYERRFRPEYKIAFLAWWKLDPINNRSAPPGPIFMPEYKNANAASSAQLAAEAKADLEKGSSTREMGDQYVKITVILATVLLLVALSQRFDIYRARVALVALALVLLALSAYSIWALPRA
jgi:hypothetical protein